MKKSKEIFKGFDNQAPALILIVDDLPENLAVLGNILRIEGYQLAIASNGKQAISIAGSKKPDLILLDVAMPEMDGLSACRILKENEVTSAIPVIFLTARTDTEDVVKGFEAGAVDYILKPFKAAELLARVSTHLELKQSRDLILKQKAELTELLSTKDKLFSIISHDLRSPFAGLLTLATMIAEDFDSFSREDLFNSIKLIRTTSDQLHSLMQNLLSWANLQTRNLHFKPQKLYLAREAKKTTDVLTLNAAKKDIAIISAISNELTVNADPDLTRIIIHNLLMNAIKFSRQGGKITLSAIEEEGFVLVRIEDEGIGIEAEKAGKLFLPGISVTTAGTANELGSGLGLMLCREMVEKMGGNIGLESVINKGSTFWFKLPGG